MTRHVKTPTPFVEFSRSVEIRDIPSHKEMSFEERSAIWRSAEDQIHTEADVMSTIQFMRSNRCTNTDQYCARGLELANFGGQEKLRFLNKVSAIAAVLKEQAKQRYYGIRDDLALVRASRCLSSWALEKALDIARLDAVAAHEINTTSEVKRSSLSQERTACADADGFLNQAELELEDVKFSSQPHSQSSKKTAHVFRTRRFANKTKCGVTGGCDLSDPL